MLKHLVILLAENSVSYCRAKNPNTTPQLMSLETLKASILFGMKENLMIQFVYPNYELPQDYSEIVETIDNIKIKPAGQKNADVVVCTSASEITEKTTALIVSKQELFSQAEIIAKKIKIVTRLTICISDIETFTENDFEKYKTTLATLSDAVFKAYKSGKTPQINLLTDRILLDKMNNCEAGIENITVAPNGNFYLCPAFYYENKKNAVGSLTEGVQIKNKQLLQLNHAPLCRNCDAFQCNRCLWLNEKTTLDINTPSHEQCVVSHLERNASKRLLERLQKDGFFAGKMIKEISYLDPFDVRKEF